MPIAHDVDQAFAGRRKASMTYTFFQKEKKDFFLLCLSCSTKHKLAHSFS